MKQVYESNPALGDPMSIQGQLTDNGQRLDKLRAEQKKYQVILTTHEYCHSTMHFILIYHYIFYKFHIKKCCISFLGFT